MWHGSALHELLECSPPTPPHSNLQGCRAVFVVSIPPITEDLDNSINAAVQAYNDGLQQLVRTLTASSSSSSSRCAVEFVDFHAACRLHIRAAQQQQQQQQEQQEQQQQQQQQQSAGSQLSAAPAEVGVWPMVRSGAAALWWRALGYNWTEVSSWRGLGLLVDNIHINETAAALLAGLLRPRLLRARSQ